MRRLVVWLTVVCFVTTQTAALAQPDAEGKAAGESANTTAKGLVAPASASQVVPGYTTTPPEPSYYGPSSLSGAASARLAACALTPSDPVCPPPATSPPTRPSCWRTSLPTTAAAR